MHEIAIIGFGAIGQALAADLASDPVGRVGQIVVPPASIRSVSQAASRLAPGARILSELDLQARARPWLVAECAGHGAILQHVVPALRSGVRCVVASIGALHEPGRLESLEVAAAEGGTQLHLISGAIGGIDALSAARAAGLTRVLYVGRKPPAGWAGSPAERACDLATLTTPTVVFRGTARDAARLFPKNANVAAAVALAGIGFDRTEVELVADPGVTRNVHAVHAAGAFGTLDVRLENQPLPTNPKTSALALYSLARTVRASWSHVVI